MHGLEVLAGILIYLNVGGLLAYAHDPSDVIHRPDIVFGWIWSVLGFLVFTVVIFLLRGPAGVKIFWQALR